MRVELLFHGRPFFDPWCPFLLLLPGEITFEAVCLLQGQATVDAVSVLLREATIHCHDQCGVAAVSVCRMRFVVHHVQCWAIGIMTPVTSIACVCCLPLHHEQ